MHDVLSRLPDLLACVTSSYGSILRIDSTKKVTKKLSGALIGPPTLATREETSFSVLQKEWSQMADGIMDWYEPANQPLLIDIAVLWMDLVDTSHCLTTGQLYWFASTSGTL